MSKTGGKAHRGCETRRTGRLAALSAKHVNVLREIVTENPSASLDAVTLQLDQRCAIKVCSKAVRNALRAVGIVGPPPKRWVVERTHASHQRPAIINTAVLPRFFRSLELFA